MAFDETMEMQAKLNMRQLVETAYGLTVLEGRLERCSFEWLAADAEGALHLVYFAMAETSEVTDEAQAQLRQQFAADRASTAFADAVARNGKGGAPCVADFAFVYANGKGMGAKYLQDRG